MKIILWEAFILDFKTTFKLQKPRFLNVSWKNVKNENCKWYLDNKEQKAVFLVVSMMFTLVLSARLLACPIGRAVWKVGLIESNLSTPYLTLLLNRFCWPNSFVYVLLLIQIKLNEKIYLFQNFSAALFYKQ